MLRKIALVAAAAVALGAASLAPTAASAHWHGGFHGHPGHFGGYHGGWRHGFGYGPRFVIGAPVYAGYNACLRKRWVPTPFGPRLRWVNVCY
jgi:hypothetical protein